MKESKSQSPGASRRMSFGERPPGRVQSRKEAVPPNPNTPFSLRRTISNCPRAARGSLAKPSRVQGLTSHDAVLHLFIKRKYGRKAFRTRLCFGAFRLPKGTQ